MEVPFLLSLIFSLGLAFLPGTLAEVTVRLKQGMIRGTKKLADLGTGNGVPYLAFTGIPYAKPPTGSRRFMRPEPIDAWEGVQGGQEVECAQEDTGRENIVSWGSPVRGQEDCLVINVYAPDLTSRRPVMVFIHGGGFFAGSGTSGVYGPDYLVAEDVVLVTVNYRLGPLGFLSLGNDTIFGNQAMWDLKLALHFIQENIGQLGGDPEKVTLFGQSAGAMAVQNLMMSPQTKDKQLFRAAILQSGPILSAFAHSDKHPAFYCRTFALAVGCDPSASASQLVQCLQKVPLDQLISQVRLFDHEDKVMSNAPNPWKPIHDGLFLSLDSKNPPFLPKDPLDALQEGDFSDIPVIIGHTKDEGVYAVTEVVARTPNAAEIVFHNWEKEKGPSYIFGREEDETDLTESNIAQQFLERFLDGGKSQDPLVLQNWFTHTVWRAADMKTGLLLANGKSSPTYYYYYTHPGRLSLGDLLSFPFWKLAVKFLAAKVNLDVFHNSLNCSTHFDEIFLLFKGNSIPFLQRHSDEDKIVSSLLLKWWTNFAKHGNPNGISGDDDDRWTPLTSSPDSKYLEISSEGGQLKKFATFFPELRNFFEEIWAAVPPRMHLPRSRTWKDPKLYGEVPYKVVNAFASSSSTSSSSSSSYSSSASSSSSSSSSSSISPSARGSSIASSSEL